MRTLLQPAVSLLDVAFMPRIPSSSGSTAGAGGAELAEVAENTEVNLETKNVPADPAVRGDTTAHGYINVYADRISDGAAFREIVNQILGN